MRTLTLAVLSLSLVLGVHCFPTGPITSCKDLPFPDACNYLPASGQGYGYGFRHRNLFGAMQRIHEAYAAAAAFPMGSLDARSLAAWSDCVELFEDINSRLQQTLSSPANDDSQTWLSSALANLETCRDGFLDFNDTSVLGSVPFTSNQFNVSQLLCNSLAINKGDYVPSPPPPLSRRLLSSSGFPEWVSAADRSLLQSSKPKADLVVAKDGSGDYKTIKEAVEASKKRSSTSTRFVIYVKEGVYKENVEVTKSMKNLMIYGDGIDKTVVTGKRSVKDGWTTFRSATFVTVGERFIGRDMTFENTAGPEKHQAVALRSGADFSVFYRCSFKGYQDTLYTHSERQFYRNCDIYGTVDFIFGDAAVVLQSCSIYCRKPMSKQKNTITAQGRSDPNENTGISIHKSRVAAASSLGSTKSYLGRPWKKYSRTVFLKTNIGDLIEPKGWLEWSGDFALDTLYYAEHKNTGAGSDTSGRVDWKGYRGEISASEASKFTVGRFISGTSWLPDTGVPFTLGL